MSEEEQTESLNCQTVWTVTQVQAQLDEMAGACNQLERAGHNIRFIIPFPVESGVATERSIHYIAIFSVSSIRH